MEVAWSSAVVSGMRGLLACGGAKGSLGGAGLESAAVPARRRSDRRPGCGGGRKGGGPHADRGRGAALSRHHAEVGGCPRSARGAADGLGDGGTPHVERGRGTRALRSGSRGDRGQRDQVFHFAVDHVPLADHRGRTRHGGGRRGDQVGRDASGEHRLRPCTPAPRAGPQCDELAAGSLTVRVDLGARESVGETRSTNPYVRLDFQPASEYVGCQGRHDLARPAAGGRADGCRRHRRADHRPGGRREAPWATDPVTRPKLGPWLRDERGKGDGLVAAAVDRLGRNVADRPNPGHRMRREGELLDSWGHDGFWTLDGPDEGDGVRLSCEVTGWAFLADVEGVRPAGRANGRVGTMRPLRCGSRSGENGCQRAKQATRARCRAR